MMQLGKLDGMLETLKKDSSYMEQRAARQAEARENWVEGLSFQPASIKQAERPPLSAGDQAKETVEKVRADELVLSIIFMA